MLVSAAVVCAASPARPAVRRLCIVLEGQARDWYRLRSGDWDYEPTAEQRDTLPLPRHAGPNAAASFEVESHGLTDRGQLRPSNEDQIVIAELNNAMSPSAKAALHSQANSAAPERPFIYGGGWHGRPSGRRRGYTPLAVKTVEKFMLNALQWFYHLRGPEGEHVMEQFQSALRQADTEIYDRAIHHPELWGIGTTLTLAFVLHTDLFVAHVGDSRAVPVTATACSIS